MINKKQVLGLALLSLILFLITSCNNSSSNGYSLDKGRLVLDKEGTIPQNQCDQRNLNNTIIVLESKYCSACKEALPKIKEAAKELGAEVTFLDLAENIDMDKADKFGVLPYYTPTMIANCKVTIGGKTKIEYTKIITEFLGKK